MDGRVEDPVAINQEDHASGHWHNFPAGLRLLVVDDDPLCLKVVEQMLKNCSYEVTTCTNATMALSLLREKNTEYDLVLSDVYMPDMDGFKLLEVVGLEMDLPVIMMSSNGDTSNVLRGVTHGACDYLIKPVRLEELRNLWQHVVRRRRQLIVDLDSDEQSQERDDDPGRNKRKAEAAGFTGDQFRSGSGPGAPCGGSGGLNGTAGCSSLVNGTVGGLGADDLGLDGGSNKKARVVWSVEMHQQFVNAVNQLGIDKAVPKKILEIMNVDGLTRENVASHLQKYRLYLKRVAGVQQPHQPRTGKQSPPAPQSPTPPIAPQPAAVAASGLPPPAIANVAQQPLPPLPGLLGHGAPPAATVCGAFMAPNGQGGGSGPVMNGSITAAAAAAVGAAGPKGATTAAAVAADGVGHSLNSGVAASHSMAAAAAAVAAGGFPGAGPHPATLLAANPMMAAAAGLNPLLGAMGGLGVGPLGAMKSLNGMGLQAQLGLISSLPGSGGPLGPMGLSGLTGLTSMASPLPLGPMSGGLQQLAAANLMQGMAVAGMGQLPGMGMNGFMGTLSGISLPGPQQHLFPSGPLRQHPRPIQHPQHPLEPKGPHHQGLGQQQPQSQQLSGGLQPQHSQHSQQQHSANLAQQQAALSLGSTARPVLPHPPQPPPQLLQPTHSHTPPPHLPHSMSLPTPSALHGPPQQLQQLILQQQLLHHHQQQLSQSQCTQSQSLQQLLPSSGSVGLHCGSGPSGLLAASADPDPGPDAAATDGTLDLHPDLIGRIIEDGFGAPPSGSLPGPPGATSGCGGPSTLDTSVVLTDGDDGSDIAAVFGEMYGSGVGLASGGLVSGLGGGMQGGGLPASAAATGLMTAMDLTSLVGGVDTHRLPGDDDFLSYLLKG